MITAAASPVAWQAVRVSAKINFVGSSLTEYKLVIIIFLAYELM